MFISLTKTAVVKNQEEILLKRWIPYQSEVSFEDFKNGLEQVQSKKPDWRTEEQILSEVEQILNNLHNG